LTVNNATKNGREVVAGQELRARTGRERKVLSTKY